MLDFQGEKDYNMFMRKIPKKGERYEEKALARIGDTKAFQPPRVYHFADFGTDRFHGRVFDLLYASCLAERYFNAVQRDHRASPFATAGKSRL